MFAIFVKIQICAYLFVVVQNLVKIGRCAAELLRIFDFQNSSRPPSWIWCDVIADHPRRTFDGPNILLKLHVHRINILRDIAILASLNCLFTPILESFGRYDGVPLGIGYRRKGSKNYSAGATRWSKKF